MRCLAQSDNLTFPFVLKACAKTCAHKEGRQMHNRVIKVGFLLDISVSGFFIHLYACSHLVCTRSVFDEMLVKDVVSWNPCSVDKSQQVIRGSWH